MTRTFNKDTWHFWIAKNFSTYSSYNAGHQNICAYSQLVAAGLVLFLATFIIGAAAAYLLSCAIVTLVVFVLHAFHVCPNFFQFITSCSYILIPGIATLITTTILLFLAGIDYVMRYMDNRPTQKKNDATMSFLGQAYKSFKDKTCIPIKFE